MDKQTLTCAQLCAASYDDNDQRFITVKEHRFGLIPIGDVTYLVFRGTDNFDEWLHDFEVVPGRTKTGYLAHEGFVSALGEVWDEVEKVLPREGKLVITGHSLGAAMAVLFAEYTLDLCITFGCPRVYSRLNAEYPQMEHTRVANRGDVVTVVPDALAWHHLCDAVFIGPEEMLDKKYHDINLYVSNLYGVVKCLHV